MPLQWGAGQALLGQATMALTMCPAPPLIFAPVGEICRPDAQNF